jgi:uncharacterized membrane protein
VNRILTFVVGVVFVLLGFNHFINPGFYEAIMPPYFPAPLFWVILSGVLEILGAIGLMLKPFRRGAAYALALLMVAFMPVHVHMLFWPAEVGVAGVSSYFLFWRFALQFVLITFFVWLARES